MEFKFTGGRGTASSSHTSGGLSNIRDGRFCVENYKLDMTQAVERSLHQATAYDPESDRLFIHGGFDLNKALADTWTFSFKANQWTKLPENPSPR